jgi:aspartate racemase
MKTVGILGGMGPYASLEFFRKILEITSPEKEKDHVRIILDNNPQIPSRNRHFIFNEESPVPAMIDSINKLVNYPVDSIYVPCNSASYFIPEIKETIDFNIVNTIEITSNAVKDNIDKGEVLVLGAYIVRNKSPYKPFLESFGYEYLEPDEEIQSLTEKTLYATKDNKMDDAAKATERILNIIPNKFPQIKAIVLACTELCIAFDHYSFSWFCPVIDSNHELAKHLVSYAKR